MQIHLQWSQQSLQQAVDSFWFNARHAMLQMLRKLLVMKCDSTLARALASNPLAILQLAVIRPLAPCSQNNQEVHVLVKSTSILMKAYLVLLLCYKGSCKAWATVTAYTCNEMRIAVFMQIWCKIEMWVTDFFRKEGHVDVASICFIFCWSGLIIWLIQTFLCGSI